MHAKPTSSSSNRARRAWLGVLLLVGLLICGHALLWQALAGRLEDGFAAWVAAQRASGRQVAHAVPVRGGWPLAATLTLPDFRWAEPGLALAAEALTLRIVPPRLDRLHLDMPGQHRLRLGETDLPLTAQRLTAALPLEAARLPSEFVLDAERLDLGNVALRHLALRLESHLGAGAAEVAAVLRATLDDLTFPPEAGPVVATLGRNLASVEWEAALSGPLPPGPASRPNVTAWRDAGGTLTLRRLDLRWGAVLAHAEGRFGLDTGLQPRGAATLRLSGGEAALEASVAAGLLAPGNAGAAGLLVRLMSRVPADGGPPELELPLTLEDRRLALARIPLGQMPAWRWPQ